MLAIFESCNKSQYLFISRPMLGKEGLYSVTKGMIFLFPFVIDVCNALSCDNEQALLRASSTTDAG